MSTLLPFHKSILEAIHDPSRGLGLRRVVCTLMKIYDSPQNLVVLVNPSQEEEPAIGEELGIMGCRKPGLRIIGGARTGECTNLKAWDPQNSHWSRKGGVVQEGRLGVCDLPNPCSRHVAI